LLIFKPVESRSIDVCMRFVLLERLACAVNDATFVLTDNPGMAISIVIWREVISWTTRRSVSRHRRRFVAPHHQSTAELAAC